MGRCFLKPHLNLGFSLLDRRTVVHFNAIGYHAGALARGGRRVHAEAADAATVNGGVGGVCRGERQVLEDGWVEHAQPVQAAYRPALVVADGVHGRGHSLPPRCCAGRAPLP